MDLASLEQGSRDSLVFADHPSEERDAAEGGFTRRCGGRTAGGTGQSVTRCNLPCPNRRRGLAAAAKRCPGRDGTIAGSQHEPEESP